MKNLAHPISYSFNLNQGARTADFHGWEMPTFYSSIIEEHRVVRNHFGIFDVSHMGRWWVVGQSAQEFLDYLTTNDLTNLKNFKAVYTLLLNEEGGIIDDLIIYKFNPEKFLVVNNAGNHKAVTDWFLHHKQNYQVDLHDISSSIGQIAVQGPQAQTILDQLLGIDKLKYFSFTEIIYAGENIIISATGYTGEKGYELYAKSEALMYIWNKLISNYNGLPCGLGARDLLRLEAGYCLHGNDISPLTTPFEAGLDWVCKLNKTNFIGKSKCQNKTKNLVGLLFEENTKIIPRSHMPILLKDQKLGEITSGNFSPYLERGIALAYLDLGFDVDFVELKIRDNTYVAQITAPWFYRNIKND